MLPHLNALCLLQEASTHGHQGIFWPLVEPVDGCAVDHGRELSGSHTQDGAHGGETQNHLDVGQSKSLCVCGGRGLLLLRLDMSFWQMAPLEAQCSLGLSDHGWGSLLQSPVRLAGYLSEPVFTV